MKRLFTFGLLVSTCIAGSGCSTSDDSSSSDSSSPSSNSPDSGGPDSTSPDSAAVSLGAANPAGTAGDAQNPPTTNGTDVEAWLAQGAYKSWSCEMLSHPQMKVSPHGKNRICINDKVKGFTSDGGTERPVGSAAVKELFDDNNQLVGYAVYSKTKATSDGGASWYWYERVPTTSAAPNTAGIVADGLGSEGRALTICVGCHSAAGSNDDHTVLGSSDFVYDQIAP